MLYELSVEGWESAATWVGLATRVISRIIPAYVLLQVWYVSFTSEENGFNILLERPDESSV